MVRDKLSSPILKVVLAITSGLLLTSAFPKTGWSWTAWFALVPLLLALMDVSSFNGFRLGFLTGLVHQTTLIYWMVYTMNTYGNLPWAVSVPVIFLLACYLALYPAVFGWIAGKLLTRQSNSLLSTPTQPSPIKGKGFKRLASLIAGLITKQMQWGLVLLPFFWTALEFCRTYLFSGFPWELLGYSQFNHIPLIQMADVAGVYGVSFLIVFVNTAVFALCLYVLDPERNISRMSKPFVIAFSSIASALVILAWAHGSLKIKQMDEVIAASPQSKITVIQGNIDQGLKWDPKFQKRTIDKYIALSKAAKMDTPDLIVWPETAAPFYFLYDQPLTKILQNGIKQNKTDFLIGAPSFSVTDKQVNYYNSAYLVTPNGSVSAKYDKVHLVPFGEYVPFKKWLPFIGKIVAQVGDFKPGRKGATLSWKNNRLGVLICYELIFPNLSRKATKNGASALINITNDAWYGRTSAPFQHFSMAVFRAVENRRTLVRSANTGFSGFIDPAGRIINQTEIFEDAVVSHSVPMLTNQSFYTQYGDMFAWVCVAFSGILIYISFWGTRKS